MSSYKSARNGEDIKREITAIIREMKDPRVAGKLLTVVRAELAADLSYGRIYVSAMEGLDAAAEACRALTHAEGMIRRELGKRLYIRKAPELKFIADDSVREGNEMWKNYELNLSGKDSGSAPT